MQRCLGRAPPVLLSALVLLGRALVTVRTLALVLVLVPVPVP
jgi:hypothetical protein